MKNANENEMEFSDSVGIKYLGRVEARCAVHLSALFSHDPLRVEHAHKQ